ncbi:MAG TPA: transglutaminase domain-containing protein [Candidatus Deferrimicrobiaceae bacterium]|jgi:transglutaminase-like putative cysteine protease
MRLTCFLEAGLAATLFLSSSARAGERRVAVNVNVKLAAPVEAQRTRLWIPYPVSDENQDISDIDISGNFARAAVYRERKGGNALLYAEWNGPSKERTLSYTFRASRREVTTKDFPSKELSFAPSEFARELAPNSLGSTTGQAKEFAARITKGKKTNLTKARAIHDWIVDNMHRDPDVKGCGIGEVDSLLRKMGGKCADIHSVFVTLCRAAGVPAREVFGIRIPKGSSGEMTKAQHCWAEFYEPGAGWIVVDPADVRKAILEKKLTVEEASPLREYYFGAVDENRIAFGTGRDIVLNPPQDGQPLNYFMYPYAEADGKVLNEDLFGFNIGYKITYIDQR